MASILVVEDSPVQSRHLTDRLTAAGHNVRAARGGQEALDMLRAQPVDIVITDLVMPEMSGLELVETIRTDYPTTPVMVVTERGSEELAVEALKAGAANYLPKRNLEKALLPVIDELLSIAVSQNRRAVFLKRMTAARYEFVLENDPELVGNVVSQVELAMQQMNLFDEADRMRVGVAVHEATLNAMIHGNLGIGSESKDGDWDVYHRLIAQRRETQPYAGRRVTITLTVVRNRELKVVVADEGDGFDPYHLPDPTDPANLDRGCGRGMLLIRTFFDEVSHNPLGNEITMIKRMVCE